MQTLLSVAGVLLSVVALGVSLWVGLRQVRRQREANFVPLLMGLLEAFRTEQFHHDYEVVCKRLPRDHDPAFGLRALPADVRGSFVRVVYLYQQFAMLVELKLLAYDDVARVAGHRMTEIWAAIEPFVQVDRQDPDSSGSGFRLLEDFVRRYREAPPRRLHAGRQAAGGN